MYDKYSVFSLNQIGGFKSWYVGEGYYLGRFVHGTDVWDLKKSSES